MKLHVIAIAYEKPVELRMLCDSFLRQTDHRWQLNIVHDGPPSTDLSTEMALYDDKRINFFSTEARAGNWGNSHRKSYLANLKGEIDDYILLTNDDNVYVPRFVEFMLGSGNMDTGMIYCNTVHSHLTYSGQISELKVSKVDGGALIVSLPLAQEVGYKHDEGHADGLYAEECKKLCIKKALKIIHINKFLFIHN